MFIDMYAEGFLTKAMYNKNLISDNEVWGSTFYVSSQLIVTET